MAANKAHGIAKAISDCLDVTPKNMLVVGCGTGEEAVSLKHFFNCEVTGIDLDTNFSAEAQAEVNLIYGDATAMEFQDEAFDFVYSYHALEHIPRYRHALAEMRRVLKQGGSWCVGTPNRSRILGYLGSADASFKEKIAWNITDWKMRLQGKFKNEHGAHAGFTANELNQELKAVFGNATNITLPYYRHIYPNHINTVNAVSAIGISTLLFPSVYFAGTHDPTL